jgi:DNA-binding CsgD family transcriptional regulator
MGPMASDPIARGSELAVIEAFLDGPAAPLRTLVLEGDVGIGKSTLWLAGVRAAQSRTDVVLQSRPAESEQGLAYVVLGDLFRSVDAAATAALPAPQRAAFEAAVLIEGGGGPVEPRALGMAILSLLPRLAAGHPLVIAIDDCQCIDPLSATTLGFALRRIEAVRVLLLLSRRPMPPGPTPIEDAVSLAGIERVRVGPMSVGGVQLLLGDRLAYRPSRTQLIRIHEASGGNPFYALELAGAQSPNPATTPEAPLVVPLSLERLVSDRLTALEPATRRALLLLATHGRVPVASLPRLDLPAGSLEPAWTARIIEDDEGTIRFSHPMLPSLLYQDAPAVERRAAHRQLAAIVADPTQRARHLALGAEAPDAAVSATLEAAASDALDRGLALAAADLAAQAVRLTPADDLVGRSRRALLGGRAYLAAGDADRARSIAVDIADRAPTGSDRAAALVLQADTESPSIAIPLLERALAEGGGPELAARIHQRLTVVGRFARSPAWTDTHAQAFAALTEQLNDPALRTTALVTLALLDFDRGSGSALERAQQAHDLAARAGELDSIAEAALAIAYIHAWSRATVTARQFLEHEVHAWADRSERVRGELLAYLAMVDLFEGRWSDAIAHDRASRGSFPAESRQSPGDFFITAHVALLRGDLKTARYEALRATTDPEAEFREDFLAVLGTVDLREGRTAEAVERFERAEQTSDAHGQFDPSLRYWRADFADALVQAGRTDDARRLLDSWQADAVRLGRGRLVAEAVRARGLLAAAIGDLATAAQLLGEAAELHLTENDPLGRGRALLGLGTVRLRLRAKRAARDDLQAALAIFEELGAAGWAAAAHDQLARIGGRQRATGLSPAERRVAELAAAGRTNQEIATTLYLSERTVAGHLSNAYAKLGLRSRSELTRRLVSETQTQ